MKWIHFSIIQILIMHLRHCCNNELWLLLKSITGLSDCGLCCTHCRVQLKFNLVELWTLGAPSGVLGGALLGAAKKKKKPVWRGANHWKQWVSERRGDVVAFCLIALLWIFTGTYNYDYTLHHKYAL